MKVVSQDALTKLIQLSKDNFIDKNDTVQATTVQLATVATTGDYEDLINTPPSIPSQTGQSGKYLTTNGTTVSWATVDALPSQTSQSGKFLTTNGTTASWASLPTVDQTYDGTSTNAQSGTAVKSAIDTALSSVYKPAGSSTFANLPTPASTNVGNVYNMTENFTTDSRFVEGAGKSYPAGTNVAIIEITTQTLYAWYNPSTTLRDDNLYCTTSPTPTTSDSVYYSNGTLTSYKIVSVSGNTIVVGYSQSATSGDTFTRDSSRDVIGSTSYKFDVLAGFVDLSGYVKKDGGSSQQTIQLTSGSGTTALGVKSRSTASYIAFNNTSGWIGSYGVTSDKKPTFYNGSSYTLAYTSDIPTQASDIGAVAANSAITGATKCKITYDSKGLVTAGADLQASDIPNLTLAKIPDITATASELNVLDGITASTAELNYTDGVTSNIQTQLNNKVTANSAITGATKCKITYDSKGLVTAGADLSASDIPDLSSTYQTKITSTAKLSADLISDGTTNKTVTATEKTTWSGKQDALVSGTNIKTINNNSLLGSGNITIDSLPSQSGQSGKYLTTNGTTASWATVDALPSQTSQSGKYLTTNGTNASWADIPTEIEWATFGLTSGQQIKTWVDAGKQVFIKKDENIFTLNYISDNGSTCVFKTMPSESTPKVLYILLSGSSWLLNNYTLQYQLPAGTSGNVLTYTGTAGSIGSTTLASVATSGSYNDLTNKPAEIPSQTSQSGKFLTTNGTTLSWDEVPSSTTVTYWVDD